jgi:hypothetical protein
MLKKVLKFMKNISLGNKKGDRKQVYFPPPKSFKIAKVRDYIVNMRSPRIIFSSILTVFSTGACIKSEVLKVVRTTSRGAVKLDFPRPPRAFFLCVKLYCRWYSLAFSLCI